MPQNTHRRRRIGSGDNEEGDDSNDYQDKLNRALEKRKKNKLSAKPRTAGGVEKHHTANNKHGNSERFVKGGNLDYKMDKHMVSYIEKELERRKTGENKDEEADKNVSAATPATSSRDNDGDKVKATLIGKIHEVNLNTGKTNASENAVSNDHNDNDGVEQYVDRMINESSNQQYASQFDLRRTKTSKDPHKMHFNIERTMRNNKGGKG